MIHLAIVCFIAVLKISLLSFILILFYFQKLVQSVIQESREIFSVSEKQKQRRERVGTLAQEGSHVSLCCQVTC